MTRVAVIGSGFVGRAWAISFARAGCEVALWDQDEAAPPKAQAYIERLLPDLEASDLLNGATAAEVAARMRVAATLESALEGAVHVQENTPEDVEVKRAVFARLDAAAPPDSSLLRWPAHCDRIARSHGSSVAVFPPLIVNVSLRSMATTSMVSLRGTLSASD